MADESTIRGQQEGITSQQLTTVSQLTRKIQSGDKLNRDENKQLTEIVKLLRENNEYQDLDKDQQKAIQKQFNENNKENTKNWVKSFKNSEKNFARLQKALSNAFAKIDSHIQTYSQYAIQVNAALDGTQKTYASAVQSLTDAVGSTGLAKMSDVLTQMSSLTERGIVANVEQNAFLMSIKDGIASTFDVANGTLLRLIKLQGEDSTTNRLVMQASLKEYLNSTYQNSQYLYEQFNNVSNNLLEATSLLTSSLGNSLEATVQKWMGSLSSLGLSDTAINNLSSTLGAVGSGNLRGISENMQNLVIMGANRTGLSYSDLLTGGLDASQTNALMQGMVDYLASLEGNNVVLSEYANIFGVTVSDLQAMRNAREQLDSIMGATISTETSRLGDYLAKYDEYLNASPATLLDTLFENALFGMGANVASNRAVYSTYQVGGLIGDITGSLGLTGVVGNLVNLIGPGIQLAAAFGGDESGFSITKIGDTLKNLGTTFGNIFADPNALLAYNMLSGENLTGTAGLISALTVDSAKNAAVGVNRLKSGSTSSSEKDPFGEGGSVTVALSSTMSAIEDAQAARTADDLYEFLSDDVVTVTPYVSEGDLLSRIEGYNAEIAEYTKSSATSLSAIWGFMREKLGPYLLFESVDEINSLFLATTGEGVNQDSDEYKRASEALAAYQQWL